MIIKNAQYVISNADWEKCPPPLLPEYAFIGRSNVGKSSLINMLTNHHNLARISGHPGKTQTINHFLINDAWWLVDLPGYGFAKVPATQRRKWEDMIRLYLCNRPNLMMVFVLIDNRLPPQKIDLDFLNKLGEWQIPFLILFTKADKVKQRLGAEHVSDFLKQMAIRWEELPRHIITSAPQKTGRAEILDYLSLCNEQFKARPIHEQ